MIPNAPRYVSPKERAENRARWLRFAYWLAVIIPVAIALMMFGYSDQAPAWLRELTVSIDGTFGFPVLWLIKAIAAP
ncbi:MAG TPA: hypothetical protein VFL68_13680 [Pseudolabrys sp.]|jgi:hypothetical protein|nr:hypothetical protein [Pseudolabrys sp.]